VRTKGWASNHDLLRLGIEVEAIRADRIAVISDRLSTAARRSLAVAESKATGNAILIGCVKHFHFSIRESGKLQQVTTEYGKATEVAPVVKPTNWNGLTASAVDFRRGRY
jgi:hypothetical protein